MRVFAARCELRCVDVYILAVGFVRDMGLLSVLGLSPRGF